MNPAPEQQHLQDLILLLDLKIEGLLDEIPYLQCYFPNHLGYRGLADIYRQDVGQSPGWWLLLGFPLALRG